MTEPRRDRPADRPDSLEEAVNAEPARDAGTTGEGRTYVGMQARLFFAVIALFLAGIIAIIYFANAS
ncbi:MAG: hypothetical protein M3P94_06675 [Chloroflexota bacterium]|nr:hypothetical protein [Chloroflexia bacterium]MDQ3168315.1 hypothetical protein [Chloroflexota bacterium]